MNCSGGLPPRRGRDSSTEVVGSWARASEPEGVPALERPGQLGRAARKTAEAKRGYLSNRFAADLSSDRDSFASSFAHAGCEPRLDVGQRWTEPTARYCRPR